MQRIQSLILDYRDMSAFALKRFGNIERLEAKFDKSPLFLLPVLFAWFATFTHIALSGRVSRSLIYDDISYFRSGLVLLVDYDHEGAKAILTWLNSPPHSVWSEIIAALGLQIANLNQWGPYFVNSICLTFLFYYMAKQFCQTRITSTLFTSFLILSPVGYLAFDQFRPDIAYIVAFTIVLKKTILNTENFETSNFFKTIIFSILTLTLIKPTWFAFTGLFLALNFARYLLMRKRFAQTHEVRYVLLLLGQIILMGFWYWEHLYNYVFVWALSDNGSTKLLPGSIAIKQSLIDATAYIGLKNSINLLVLCLFAFLRFFYVNRKSKFAYKSGFLSFTIPIVMSIPVLKSGMPSPFQGLLWILPLVFFSIGFYVESIAKQGRELEFLLIILLSLMIFAVSPLTKVGSFAEISRPIYSVEKVADALVEDCLAQETCNNEHPSPNAPRVGMLAFGLLSPESIEFYALRQGIQLHPQLLDLTKALSKSTSTNLADFDYLITYAKDHWTMPNRFWSDDNAYLEEQNWEEVEVNESSIYKIWRIPTNSHRV